MFNMPKTSTDWIRKFRENYAEYRSEIIFGMILSGVVVLSYALSPLIPASLFRWCISPALNCAVFVSCMLGAWSLFRHHEGMRIRKMCAGTMVVWSVLMFIGVMLKLTHYNNSLDAASGLLSMDGWEFVMGGVLGWLFLIYPTELLRPGWLNFKRACLQILPIIVAGVLDELLDIDLRWLLAIYPFALLAFIGANIRAYRNYCEENYSSMENIDVQWVVRYLIMIVILGASFCFLTIAHFPTRLFTQQWLLFFIISYSNEQILFRPDPWREDERQKPKVESQKSMDQVAEDPVAKDDYCGPLEMWMKTEKPYLNKDFRLTDLMQVLPMNRTYLSQFINTEYGCNFYQYVTKYRIEEAKRLMSEQPSMKMQEVAEQCGFSSSTVFGRIFARETGMTPKEWSAQNDNS